MISRNQCGPAGRRFSTSRRRSAPEADAGRTSPRTWAAPAAAGAQKASGHRACPRARRRRAPRSSRRRRGAGTPRAGHAPSPGGGQRRAGPCPAAATRSADRRRTRPRERGRASLCPRAARAGRRRSSLRRDNASRACLLRGHPGSLTRRCRPARDRPIPSEVAGQSRGRQRPRMRPSASSTARSSPVSRHSADRPRRCGSTTVVCSTETANRPRRRGHCQEASSPGQRRMSRAKR